MSDKLIMTSNNLNYIVEGLGKMDWRDENGFRLVDTVEWVEFYVALKTNEVQEILERNKQLADNSEQEGK